MQANLTSCQPVDLRHEHNLLKRFERDVVIAGLVGEQKNAQAIFLAAVSAGLAKPLNVSVHGSSSAGKNHLIGAVARFIPDQRKKVLTGMSPKVLMHSGEDELQHKAIFIAEYEGVSGADYAIRTMQSERVIEWEYVESSKTGLKKKTNRVKGPAAFIQATTRVTLHPENETRLLFLRMDESEQQTRAINLRQAQEAEGKILPTPEEMFEAWHELINSLEPREVRIPFATQLAESLPPIVRARRDLPKLLGLIEASAYLHQHQRPKDENDNIVALPQDYINAKELFEHSYFTGPDASIGELLQAAGQLLSDDFCAADLIKATGWKKSKLYEVLARAQELGNIVDGNRWGRHRLLHSQLEPTLQLPAKIRLSVQDFRISTAIGVKDSIYADSDSVLRGVSLSGITENERSRLGVRSRDVEVAEPLVPSGTSGELSQVTS